MINTAFELKLHGGPVRWYVHMTDPQGVQHATGTYHAHGLGLTKSEPVMLGGWASTGRSTLEFMQDFAHGLLSLKIALAEMAELIGDGTTTMEAELAGPLLRVRLRCGKLSAQVEANYLDEASGEDLEVTKESADLSFSSLVKDHPKKFLVFLWHDWAIAQISEMIRSKTREEMAALREGGARWY